jgi:hypothetical protein
VNVGPFPVAAVIERLRVRVPELKLVDGAAGLLAAEKQQPSASPAAFVVANERAGPSKGYTGGTLAQPVAATCVVVIYVKHAGSATSGAKAQQQLDALRGLIRNVLVNWKPMAGGTVLRFIASDGESYQAGSLQGQEAYGLDYTLEKGANP